MLQRRDTGYTLDADPRELPAYSIQETARYLQIPLPTVRSWVRGRYYPTEAGQKLFAPIILLPNKRQPLLSFMNLVEASILAAIRRKFLIPLPKVRQAISYLGKRFPSRHPLADHRFESDGLNLFVEKFGQLINVSQEGQLALRQLLEAHLRRIDRDFAGLPARFYLFTRRLNLEEPKVVVIDPHVSFGRPVLVGTGIPTAVIAERYKVGESIDELASDYGRERLQIEEAIRCELQLEAA